GPSMQPSRFSVHMPARADERPTTGTPNDPDEGEFRLRWVMDAIPELVWSALPNGHVEFCNQKWLGYTGMALDEVQGWGWAAAIHPEDIRDLQERWREALTQGTSFEAEARMRSVDGS